MTSSMAVASSPLTISHNIVILRWHPLQRNGNKEISVGAAPFIGLGMDLLGKHKQSPEKGGRPRGLPQINGYLLEKPSFLSIHNYLFIPV